MFQLSPMFKRLVSREPEVLRNRRRSTILHRELRVEVLIFFTLKKSHVVVRSCVLLEFFLRDVSVGGDPRPNPELAEGILYLFWPGPAWGCLGIPRNLHDSATHKHQKIGWLDGQVCGLLNSWVTNVFANKAEILQRSKKCSVTWVLISKTQITALSSSINSMDLISDSAYLRAAIIKLKKNVYKCLPIIWTLCSTSCCSKLVKVQPIINIPLKT